MNMNLITECADLRRVRRSRCVETVLRWARYLGPSDQELIRLIYGDALKVKTVAQMMSISPDALRKRVRRVVLRLADPDFQRVAERLDELPPRIAEVARRCVLEGQSAERAALDCGMHASAVRLQRRMINVLLAVRSERNVNEGAPAGAAANVSEVRS